MQSRILKPSLLSKVVKNPQDLLPHFQNGQALGWSGFSSAAYPKVIPKMLANHVEKSQEKMRFNLFVGASVSSEIEDRWASLDMIARRYPYQEGRFSQEGINTGKIQFADTHLSKYAQDLVFGHYKTGIDVAVIEAVGITADGNVVLGPSVGLVPAVIAMAKKVIIEINTSLPNVYEGMHDLVFEEVPPFRRPIMINKVTDRIGTATLPIDPEKIVGIVESTESDVTKEGAAENNISGPIAEHILEFFKQEVKSGRLRPNLLPLQSGIGNIANAVIAGLANGPFSGVTVWTEVLQDSFLDFFETGKLDAASTCALHLTPKAMKRFHDNINFYKERVIMRPEAISNCPEVIRRLGIIAMNTPIEFDIYGHANSTNVLGSRMLHGIGGSADFERNGKITILHCPSTRPTASDPHGVTSIVPFASHVDHTEHDVAVYVTEQGLADIRGMSPKERAKEIIDKCAHPVYKDILNDYLKTATAICTKKKMAHEPHMLQHVFKMHLNLMEKGTMRIDKW